MLLSSPKIRSIYHTHTESIVETHGFNFNLAEIEFSETLHPQDTPRTAIFENRGALPMISIFFHEWIQLFLLGAGLTRRSLGDSVQIEAVHVNREDFRKGQFPAGPSFLRIRIWPVDCKPAEFVQPCGGRAELYILCV